MRMSTFGPLRCSRMRRITPWAPPLCEGRPPPRLTRASGIRWKSYNGHDYYYYGYCYDDDYYSYYYYHDDYD